MGLVLGWMLAGEFFSTGVEPTFAAQEHSVHADSIEAAGDPHHDEAHEDAGLESAAQLKPGKDQVPFFSPVLRGIVVLFAVALLIGLICRVAGYGDPGAEATEQDLAEAEH